MILTSRAAFANSLRLLRRCKCLKLVPVFAEEKDEARKGSSWVLPVIREGRCLEYSFRSLTDRGGEQEWMLLGVDVGRCVRPPVGGRVGRGVEGSGSSFIAHTPHTLVALFSL